MKVGRPTKYSQEIANQICSIISTSHKSLRTVSREVGVDVSNILRWINDNKEFREQYTRAKEEQADYLVEEMIDISEHTEEDHTPFTGANVIQRDRLRVETRKWIASKLKPKKYGDKLDIEHTVVEQPLFSDDKE